MHSSIEGQALAQWSAPQYLIPERGVREYTIIALLILLAAAGGYWVFGSLSYAVTVSVVAAVYLLVILKQKSGEEQRYALLNEGIQHGSRLRTWSEFGSYCVKYNPDFPQYSKLVFRHEQRLMPDWEVIIPNSVVSRVQLYLRDMVPETEYQESWPEYLVRIFRL